MTSVGRQIKFCTSFDGVRIAYASAGAGPPIIKAAHWLTHLQFDWPSPVWRHWLTELSANRLLVRYDERGCGLSDRDVTDLSFESWVRDLEAVADATGLDRFALFGMSQGGAVAVAYAARHPDRVTHLVLCGAYARGRYLRGGTEAEIEENEMTIELAQRGWDRDNPAFRQTFASLLCPDGAPEQHRSFTEMMRLSTSAVNAGELMRQFTAVDVRELAPQVRCPALIVHARDDGGVPFEEGRLLASLIPGSRFVPVEGRNHILLEHEPAWQQFVEELRAFLPDAGPKDRAGDLPDAFRKLSTREREVTGLIADGLDNKQIAERLLVSEKTVRNHVTSIFWKLGVRTRARAIVRAREAGFGNRGA